MISPCLLKSILNNLRFFADWSLQIWFCGMLSLMATAHTLFENHSTEISEKASGLACSSSCLSLCSCDSSCLLWSSRICILASRRPLCWRSSLASAISSASRGLCGETGIISGGDGSGDNPLWSCCCFKRSYSACKFLLKSDREVKLYQAE